MCREADGSVDGAPSKKLKSDPDASAVVSFNYSNWSNLSVLLHPAMPNGCLKTHKTFWGCQSYVNAGSARTDIQTAV